MTTQNLVPENVFFVEGGITKPVDDIVYVFLGEEVPPWSSDKIDVLVDFVADGSIQSFQTNVPPALDPVEIEPTLVEKDGRTQLFIELPR